jgi:epoxide hydrolase-like predicted phosphatase
VIKAVIFDMGGVLLRTIDPSPREALGQRYGFTLRQLFEIVFGSESSQQAERGEKTEAEHWSWALDQLGVAQEDRESFIHQWWAGDRMDYDLLQFIDRLRPAVRTGLLSNAWMDTRANITEHWGSLDPYFDVVIFSAEAGMRKPAPEFFHWLLEKLGARSEEAIFVDDFGENIQAAQALGLHTVKFFSPDQARQEVLEMLDHTVRG